MPERACCSNMNKPNMVVWWSYCEEHDQHQTSVYRGTVTVPTAREHDRKWGPFESATEIVKYLRGHLDIFATAHTKQQSLL